MNKINEIDEQIKNLEAEEQFEKNRRLRILQLKEAKSKAEKEKENQEKEKEEQELEKLKRINLIKTLAYLQCPKCKKEVPLELADRRLEPGKSAIYIEIQGTCRNKKCQVKTKHTRNKILESPVLYAKLTQGMSVTKRLQHGAF